MVPDPLPQPVTAPLTPAAIFLVVTIDEGGEAAVHDALPDISGLVRAVGFRDTDKHLSVVTSIGSDAWDRLFSGPRPGRADPVHRAATARATTPRRRRGICCSTSRRCRWTCASSWRAGSSRRWARSPSSTRCTASGSSTTATCWASSTAPRTRTGHLRCPPPRSATRIPISPAAATSHVQKYVHDMASWESLSVTEQELVIGRTKLEDIEMDDDAKPANAHIALNVIEDEDGNELKIVRHNMPFGEIGKGEFGTYFIGYSRTAAVTERMLRNMFIGDPPGNTDRILDFSTAVTGGKFFTPIVDFLNDPPPLPDSAARRRATSSHRRARRHRRVAAGSAA